MSDDVRSVADRIHETFNSRDLNGLAACWHPEVVYTAPGVELAGLDARMAAEHVWLDAFPDAVVTIDRRVVEGAVVVDAGRMVGTHTGVLRTPEGDVPPTGETVDGAFVSLFVFDGGQVVRQEIIYDRLSLMEQLGVGSAA